MAIAGRLFNTPIALITLIDDRRQWFKARIGLTVCETHREISFCSHAIVHPDEVMVVPDARADPRFAANPLVTSGPLIRFYAGAPLRTDDGYALGTLCVASPEARPEGLSPAEKMQLSALAASVMDALSLRLRGIGAERAEDAARIHLAREERLRLALEVANACAWELDPATGLTTWDASALQLLGVPDSIGLQEALELFVHPGDVASVLEAVASSLHPGGSGRFKVEHRARSRTATDGSASSPASAVWLHSTGEARFEGTGDGRRAVRLIGLTVDITERHAAAERHRLLVSELNHRVKNTLAVVQSIAEQTRRSAWGRNSGRPRDLETPERRQFHSDFNARLRALATAHDTLTREAWRGASFDELVRDLVAPYAGGVAAAGSASQTSDRFTVAGPSMWLTPDAALALALIVHELSTNAAKHGALSSVDGQVSVSWGSDERMAAVWLSWVETGGPSISGPPVQSGFGTRLIDVTVRRQLGGSLATIWRPVGLSFRLEMPMARALHKA